MYLILTERKGENYGIGLPIKAETGTGHQRIKRSGDN